MTNQAWPFPALMSSCLLVGSGQIAGLQGQTHVIIEINTALLCSPGVLVLSRQSMQESQLLEDEPADFKSHVGMQTPCQTVRPVHTQMGMQMGGIGLRQTASRMLMACISSPKLISLGLAGMWNISIPGRPCSKFSQDPSMR